MPGKAMRQNSSRSTLPNRQCASPETPVVTVSAACTLALATAGATPTLSSTVVAVMP